MKLHTINSKITKGKFSLVHGQRSFGIVEVETFAGARGYAEIYSSLYVTHETLFCAITEVSQIFKNLEITELRHFRANYTPALVSRSGILFNVWMSLESALYDAYKKEFQKTTFCNRTSASKPLVYLSGGSNLLSKEELRDEYLEATTKYDGYKFRVGFGNQQEHIEKISVIAGVSDGNCRWMVDAIAETRREPYIFEEIMSLIAFAKDSGAYWFEEPLRMERLNDYEDLCIKFPRFIALGESTASKLEVEIYGRLIGLGWLQLDFSHNTSIFDLLFPEKTCLSNMKNISIHCWGSRLSFRSSYLLALETDHVEWVEKSAVEYEIDEFFENPVETDSELIPTNQFKEMLKWLKKHGQHRVELAYSA